MFLVLKLQELIFVGINNVYTLSELVFQRWGLLLSLFKKGRKIFILPQIHH